MPVYTYHCEACGVTFDQRLGFRDTHPTSCPKCGAEALHRVYKPVGIVFKGSGFYATDHRSPSGNKNGSREGHDLSMTKVEGQTQNETTPASNAKTKTSPQKTPSEPSPSATDPKN